ncbi:hypothetical protein [Robiginitalea biformata]|uniref:hypothetical protein n=1 Tax=Robiginitalea TaxID=252306 RepID=UPI00373FDE21
MHGGTPVGRMVRAAGFKGAHLVKARIHHKKAADTRARISDIYRVSRTGKRAVEREVEVHLKAEPQLLQVRVPVACVVAACQEQNGQE